MPAKMTRLQHVNTALLPLFFMHVPKCAGNSINALVSQLFTPDEICPRAAYGIWRAEGMRGYQLYRGHFSADFIEDMGDGGSTLIMLRDPVDRIVSLYDFWRSYRWDYICSALPPPPNNGPAAAKRGDLMTFLDATSPFVRDHVHNRAARQLLGRRFEALWPDEDALAAESIRALRAFTWVGVTELYALSIAALSRLLGLPRSKNAVRENSTYDTSGDPNREPVRRHAVTDAERQRILEVNRVDLAIYREARRLVRERASLISRFRQAMREMLRPAHAGRRI